MQSLASVLGVLVLPAIVWTQFQAQDNRKKPQFFIVPPGIILPVVAYQRDCPLEFVRASILNHVDGGGIETFQIRNRGTRPIRAYTIATVTSVGSGASWDFRARKPAEWIMAGQMLPPSVETSIEIVPITDEIGHENKLDGPMKGITIFMVGRAEYDDGSAYSAEAEYKALQGFFEKQRIWPQ